MEISWIITIVALAIAATSVVLLLAILYRNHQSAGNNKMFEMRLEQMLTPLQEKLETFRSVVTQTHALQIKDRADLQAQIRQLVNLNKSIGDEAKQLTSALKNDTKKQGDWGEMHLITLLEQGGLKKGIHFNVQVTHRSDGTVLRGSHGEFQRPDVIINLPDDKQLIIDAKTSLKAYVEYSSAETPDNKKAAAKRHILSIRRHVDELGNKQYQSSLPDAIGHVLMYIPLEGAFLLAVEEDPSLWKYAYDRNVALVTSTHLFSIIQLLGQLWHHEAQTRNVLLIAAEGGKLYDKLVVFTSHFSKIEDSIRILQARFDDAKKSLTEGRGNLLNKAEKMRSLGAQSTKRLPEKLLSLCEEDDE